MGLLRILLAVCVYCEHTVPLGNLHWLRGNLAVEMFFVISGFYMQLVLSGKYSKASLGPSWVTQFYKARYFRLLPVYLLGFFLSAGTDPFRASSNMLSNWRMVWELPNSAANLAYKTFLALTNLTIFGQDVTMFLGVHQGQVHWTADFSKSDAPLWQGLAMPQGWSLGVELLFYLCAPFLLNVRSRWLVLLAAGSLAIKAYTLHAFQLGDPWENRFFPFEIGNFLLGSLAFRHRRALSGFIPAGIGSFVVYPAVAILATTLIDTRLSTFLYPMLLAVLLPLIFSLTASHKMDRWIGEISYPFYVLHMFTYSIAASVGRILHQSEVGAAWIGLAFTLGLSGAAWMLEARYIEPWRARFAEPAARR